MNQTNKKLGVIYAYIKKDSGKVMYVGKTTDLEKRIKEHKSMNGSPQALYKAFRDHGYDAFNLEIIEELPNGELADREVYWIDHHNTYRGDGYNLSPGGDGVNRDSLSQESKKKIRGRIIEPREGHSRDYNEDKRQFIFDTYKEMIGEHTLVEICHKLGISSQVFYMVRQTNWWKEKVKNNGE